MKKLIAFALSLMLILTACAAFAETRTFVLKYVTDAEGIDKEVEELPELTINMDLENKVCTYATAEGVENGTVEVKDVFEAPNPCTLVRITLESGDAFDAYVYEDQLEIKDEANDVGYVLPIAEFRSYRLAYVTDAEGIDKEVEELPELTIVMDMTNQTCTCCTAESEENGTFEVVADYPAEDGRAASKYVKITLSEGEVINAMVYEDQIEIIDDANDVGYVLTRGDVAAE